MAEPPEPSVAFVAVPAPWGPIHIAASTGGLVALEVLTPAGLFEASVQRRTGSVPERLEVATPRPIRAMLEQAARAVDAFLAGRPTELDLVPLDLRIRTSWDRRVLEGVRRIPFGAVTSYGRLAALIGAPGAARAVGGAVGRNPIGLAIPCHRVIAGDGSIGGYGGDWWGGRDQLLAVKRELLALEGTFLPASAFVG